MKPAYFSLKKKTCTAAQIQQPGHTVSERFIHQLKDTQLLKCLTGLGPIRQNSLQVETQFVHGLKQFEHFIWLLYKWNFPVRSSRQAYFSTGIWSRPHWSQWPSFHSLWWVLDPSPAASRVRLSASTSPALPPNSGCSQLMGALLLRWERHSTQKSKLPWVKQLCCAFWCQR